jgi:hypothetical protein
VNSPHRSLTSDGCRESPFWHNSDLPRCLLSGRSSGRSRHQSASAHQSQTMSTRPNDDGPGLPMAAHGGNICPERRIIRWMSD